MNLWRLESLRLIRTHRWAILIGVYAFFGILGPLTARYFGEIVGRFASDMVLEVPDPRPVDGIEQFLANATQVGLLAVVVVAAGSLALDARAEVAAFLRTRVERARELLWPRYAIVTVTAIAALMVGTGLAWAFTTVLIGSLPAGGMLLGTLLGAVYLAFAVAVLAAVAGYTSGTVPMVFTGLVVLLVLPLLGLLPPVEPWLPSHLIGSVTALVEGAPATDYTRAAVVTLVAIPVLLAVAARQFERREI
jgi:ABC-2 type transport system permease protein